MMPESKTELPNSLTSDDVRKILAIYSGMDPEDITGGTVRLWRRSDAFKLLEAAMESGVLVRAEQSKGDTHGCCSVCGTIFIPGDKDLMPVHPGCATEQANHSSHKPRLGFRKRFVKKL